MLGFRESVFDKNVGDTFGLVCVAGSPLAPLKLRASNTGITLGTANITYGSKFGCRV